MPGESVPFVEHVDAHMGEISELGLGLAHSNWPSGALQDLLELVTVHVTGGDWVLALVGTTVVIRSCMFPLAVMGQRNAVGVMNLMPETVEIQKRMNQAKEQGDTAEQMAAYGDLQKVYKREGLSPLAGVKAAIGQMFIFVPMFFACRGLGNAEVPSMLDGGNAWFPNLCAADPVMALPVISAVSMLLMIEGGAAEGMQMSPQMKWAFRGMSVMTLVVTMNMPAFVLLYFATSNTFSLAQSLALKTPPIRRALGIPAKIDHGIELPTSGGFMKTVQNVKKRFDEQEEAMMKKRDLEDTDIRARAMDNLQRSREARRSRQQRKK